jgi:hypothetical protein
MTRFENFGEPSVGFRTQRQSGCGIQKTVSPPPGDSVNWALLSRARDWLLN